MVDSNINTHALGNSFTNINGFYDLYVNGSAKTVSPSPNDSTSSSAFNVKIGSGNASVVTQNGDINIVAGGNGRVILKGSEVVFTSGDGKPIDQKTFGLDNYNLKGFSMGQVDLRSKSMNYKSEGAIQMNSSNHNIVTGDYSRVAVGYWVENGEIQYPVEEITIAGNLKDVFKKIVTIGNDVDSRSNIITPSLLVDELMVAGS